MTSPSKPRDFICINLNGKPIEVRGDTIWMMLAEWLRKERGLTGTKIVCAEGDCGACTVLRAFPTEKKKPLKFYPVNSCIATMAQLDGSHIVTIEGVQVGSELSPVQEAMKSAHASQCGYCTPGFVMALTGLFECHNQADMKLAANYTTGNLCRCTGYSPILDAAQNVEHDPRFSVAERYISKESEKALRHTMQIPVKITNISAKFYAPTNLKQAENYLARNPNTKILGSATDLGVQFNKGKPFPLGMMSLHLISELYEIKETKLRITVGACASLARLRRICEGSTPEFSRMLNVFASPQIKNSATLVGNVANASPIGDTLPFLLISDAMIHVSGTRRKIPMDRFYLGYKSLNLKPGEFITHISFRKTQSGDRLCILKASQRKDLDISTVSGAFMLRMDETQQIQEARIAYGGVAATPVRLPGIEKSLLGSKLNLETIDQVATSITKAITPIHDMRGSAEFRLVLASNLFRKFAEGLLS